MKEKSSINLKLINIQTGAVVKEITDSNMKEYIKSVSLKLHSGIYALVLETNKQTGVFKVAVK